MAHASGWCWGALAVALVLSGAGCGTQAKPVKVEGHVTLDDKPVYGATVTFMPETKAGHWATARTKSDGSFQLITANLGDGAVPGEYKVVISFSEEAQLWNNIHEGMSMAEANAEYNKAMGQLKNKIANPTYVIPDIYSDLSKTPLKQKVPPEGEVVFALQSKGSEPP